MTEKGKESEHVTQQWKKSVKVLAEYLHQLQMSKKHVAELFKNLQKPENKDSELQNQKDQLKKDEAMLDSMVLTLGAAAQKLAMLQNFDQDTKVTFEVTERRVANMKDTPADQLASVLNLLFSQKGVTEVVAVAKGANITLQTK